LKIALVHDYFTTYAGAERVIENILREVPEADVFGLFDALPASERGFLQGREVTTSWLQTRIRKGHDYRRLLPLFPLAVRDLDVSDYDLVISSSHSFAKGLRIRRGQVHACYCYSPMRWAWDLREQYLQQMGLAKGLKGVAVRSMLACLRRWDRRTSRHVHSFATLSQHIRRRIASAYDRDARIIYPPVDTEAFRPGDRKGDHFVTLGRLVPYKRTDVLIEAMRGLPDERLVIIGDGPMRDRLQRDAPANVEFMGRLDHADALPLIQEAKAFLFAAEEDFGIAPVEAQAAGTPVIAYGVGGALDTIQDGVSGLFFDAQEPESVQAAIRRFSAIEWNPERVRANALRFTPERFRAGFRQWIDALTQGALHD